MRVPLFLVGRLLRPTLQQGPSRFDSSADIGCRVVRHPIMLGFLVAFRATPTMTWGHLVFAGMTTAYIVVGVCLEERDMRRAFGDTYDQYRSRVGMLLPRVGGDRSAG